VIRSHETSNADASASRFDQLFERHRVELVRLATIVLGNSMSAEDIVQETFFKLSTAHVLERADQEIAAWLRRVCVNASLNQLRTDRRRRERDGRLMLLNETSAPEHDSPETQIVHREEQERVRAALDAISEPLCACLVLRHSGYSYAEIAGALEIAIGSVGVYLARGERAFRGQFEETTI
jgi:RNA polymerase sigma factor (sigma-70 family)